MLKMKALSLKQPFAELVVSGRKTVELRKWNTRFRGEFFVHASKNTDKKRCESLGFKNLPEGMIVGKAELVSVIKYEKSEDLERDKDLHFALDFYDVPVYGFVLKNIRRGKPVALKGALGFFNVNSDVLAEQ